MLCGHTNREVLLSPRLTRITYCCASEGGKEVELFTRLSLPIHLPKLARVNPEYSWKPARASFESCWRPSCCPPQNAAYACTMPQRWFLSSPLSYGAGYPYTRHARHRQLYCGITAVAVLFKKSWTQKGGVRSMQRRIWRCYWSKPSSRRLNLRIIDGGVRAAYMCLLEHVLLLYGNMRRYQTIKPFKILERSDCCLYLAHPRLGVYPRQYVTRNKQSNRSDGFISEQFWSRR